MTQSESLPTLNVLTRTSGRPRYFEQCRASVLSQSYPAMRHIVAVDDEASESYLQGVDFVRVKHRPRHRFRMKLQGTMPIYHAPYNLYLNTLAARVREGYVMYLDDDDAFTSPTAAATIMEHTQQGAELLLWKVRLVEKLIPEPKYFGKPPKIGHISGIGFAFHSRFVPLARWDEYSCGDYRVSKRLYAATERRVWIDEVLTMVQRPTRAGFGRRDDAR